MIPVRLELKNFMSYGEQVTPLDLSGVHIACLCGDNGHGKSALLDAITWALWGEARAPADELIRLGTDEMRVVFDFEFGGNLYRIIRGRSKRKSGTVWEIAVSDGNGELKPITGQGIRDTGRQIVRILRMDYKTFINSAYIQQGKADEFTKQTVADRKKILADILDLSRYDWLEQRAKERRSEVDLKASELGREIEQIELELAQENAWQLQLDEAMTERGDLEAEITKVEEKARTLQARQAELETKARRIDELEDRAARLRSELESLALQKADQERRVARGKEILRDRERILSGQERLKDVRDRIAWLDDRLEQLRKLELDKAGLERDVLVAKNRIEADRDSVLRELAELDGKCAAAGQLQTEMEELRAQVRKLDELAASRASLQAEFSANADRWGELKSRYEHLLKMQEELEEKLRLISQPGAKCPLCEAELDHAKHSDLIAGYRRQIEENAAQIKRVKGEGAEARNKRDASQKEIETTDRELQGGLDVRKRLAQAEQLLFQIEESRRQEPRLREKLAGLEAKLDSGDYARDIRARVREVQEQINELEYDPAEHTRLKQEVSSLQEFEDLAAGLKHAQENLPSDESSLKAVTDLIEARQKSVAECEQTAKDLSSATADLAAVASELSEVSASLRSLRERDRELTGRIATLKHSLERCGVLRVQASEKRKEVENAKREKSIYTELVAAFGKKGLQALIIENAIPEIQEEANRLLARMTDNAMQVSFETVRDKKTGGTAETLDIKVSDDMGTRSYELYSGGEAFRVNFALRIALSKLLARRAGARLQTLIIDEGFGTQDGKGREKLVEAINSIRDDFEKILVVTHIDELKDAFPTRIEITKDGQGSQISVS